MDKDFNKQWSSARMAVWAVLYAITEWNIWILEVILWDNSDKALQDHFVWSSFYPKQETGICNLFSYLFYLNSYYESVMFDFIILKHLHNSYNISEK